ncbi:anti-sigma factor family protein [Corynebacterium tapiri]|nr:zf-HC2 domain-containing protein [Corynebacterium tapiri]
MIKPSANRSRKKREKTYDSVEHLSPEAVAAYVDCELSATAQRRARMHVIHCEECRREVVAQRKASQLVKEQADADQVCTPPDLLNRLCGLSGSSVGPGPGAESATHGHPEDIFDRVDHVVRGLFRPSHR